MLISWFGLGMIVVYHNLYEAKNEDVVSYAGIAGAKLNDMECIQTYLGMRLNRTIVCSNGGLMQQISDINFTGLIEDGYVTSRDTSICIYDQNSQSC
jgi:hypothetical protein